MKVECLADLEKRSDAGQIDLLYGDESHFSLLPYVPRAWVFADETVVLPSERGGNLSAFALLSRSNRCFVRTTEGRVTGDWIAEQIDAFAEGLSRLTVVVLDNAAVHIKAVKERLQSWEDKGLFVWFLPTYSPQLNIAEILWKKVKYEWLQPCHYRDKATLHEAVNAILGAVGTTFRIAFKAFGKV